MASASKFNSNHIRSISLPTRSHPSIVGIVEEMNKLNVRVLSSPPTVATVRDGLAGLECLYKSIDDLLSLPLTQQAISHNKQEKWMEDLLDGSVRLLDICGTIRDFLSQIKEHVIDLQSSIRRRKGDLSIKSSIIKFTSFRKKMKRDAKTLVANLKQVHERIACSLILDLDHHLLGVIKVLREVSAVSVSVFHSLLLFLSTPFSKSTRSKWSLVSKLIHKGTVVCEGQLQNMNELENVDSALYNWSEGDEKMGISRKRLEALHSGIEVIENGTELIFRGLIRTRASLLNIISQI